MLFPWKTVGLHVPNSSSSAICVLNMEDSPGTVHTKLVQVHTSICLYILVYHSVYCFNHLIPDDLLRELVFFNTFEELNLPIKGPMDDSGAWTVGSARFPSRDLACSQFLETASIKAIKGFR